MDMFLIIPNFSHALVATLDLFLLGVVVYDWTSFLTTKTLGIDTKSSAYVARFQDYWIPYILAIMLIHYKQSNNENAPWLTLLDLC